jgi:hypothetical protein
MVNMNKTIEEISLRSKNIKAGLKFRYLFYKIRKNCNAKKLELLEKDDLL